MRIELQTLHWYPDEVDTDVLVDFTIRRTLSALSEGNGSDSGEATDFKFRICQEDVKPELGIRFYPITKLDLETQHVTSDVDALVVIARDTWAQLNDASKQTWFINYLTLVVGKMYLAD